MGSSSGTSQSTTTQQLTPEQQSLVNMAMPGWQQFASGGAPNLPTGNQAVAPFNPAQLTGQQSVLGSTGTQGGPTPVYMPTSQAGGATTAQSGGGGAAPNMTGVTNTAANTNQYLSSGAFLDPSTNPNVQNAIKAATQPIYQQLSTQTLPQLQAGAAGGSGVNFGGSREGIAEGLASTGASQAAGNVAGNIEGTALGQGLNATLAAIGQAPTTASSLAIPGATTSAVGDVQQQQAQNVLNANNAAALTTQMWPLIQAQLLTQGAGALPGGSTTSTGQTTQEASPWQMITGGASAAGGLMGGLGALLPFL